MSISSFEVATSYSSLVQALEHAPEDHPFVTYWADEDSIESVTFGEFIKRARHAASFLSNQGIRQGDRVVLILPQGIDLMAVFAGAMMLGAIPAILAYPNFKVEPNKYNAGLKGVSTNLQARLVVIDEGFPQELLTCVQVSDATQTVSYGFSPSIVIEEGLQLPKISSNEIAFIQHSAGTTGLQKGVALSHGAVLRHLGALQEALRLRGDERIYSWLPLYHDMGLVACFMLPMALHLPVVMQSPIDWVMQPQAMLHLITEYRCTHAWIPNFALQFLARRTRPSELAQIDLSSLRGLINCSEPVRVQSIDEFLQVFEPCGANPACLQSSYAMAENVFAVTQSNQDGRVPARITVDREAYLKEHKAEPVPKDKQGAISFVSSGTPVKNNHVLVVDEEGKELPEGHVGELMITSDTLFSGYFNRPDLTGQAMRGNWYKTGDLGFVWAGELYVTGRKRDLIIVAGKNIYPLDVEEITCSHPAIRDGRAIALGMMSKELGTEEIIVVAETEDECVLADSRPIEMAIKGHVVAELGVAIKAVYIKPLRWIVKSTAGKPSRAGTKEKLLKEHPELQELYE